MSQGRETDAIVRGPGHALHLEHRVAAAGRHHEAHRRWPNDAAGELRAIQSGRADRRVRVLPPRRDRRSRRRPSSRRPAAIRRSSRWSIRGSTSSSIPTTRAPRTDEYSIGVDREVGRRLAVAIAYVRKDGAQLHRLDGRRRAISRGDADAARRPQRAGVRARQRHGAIAAFCLTNPEATR